MILAKEFEDTEDVINMCTANVLQEIYGGQLPCVLLDDDICIFFKDGKTKTVKISSKNMSVVSKRISTILNDKRHKKDTALLQPYVYKKNGNLSWKVISIDNKGAILRHYLSHECRYIECAVKRKDIICCLFVGEEYQFRSTFHKDGNVNIDDNLRSFFKLNIKSITEGLKHKAFKRNSITINNTDTRKKIVYLSASKPLPESAIAELKFFIIKKIGFSAVFI